MVLKALTCMVIALKALTCKVIALKALTCTVIALKVQLYVYVIPLCITLSDQRVGSSCKYIHLILLWKMTVPF